MAIQTRAKTGDENRLTHGAMNRRSAVMHGTEMRAYFAPRSGWNMPWTKPGASGPVRGRP